MLLEDKSLVITGASGGLGPATVRAALEAGARVTAGYHSGEDRWRQVEAEVDAPERLQGVPADLTAPEGADDLINRAVEVHGGLDGLVNIAGGYAEAPLGEMDLETWESMFELNVRTAFLTTRAALAAFDGGGCIVNVASTTGEEAEAGLGAYAASKGAVIRLTEATAREGGDRGVRANVVLPGTIDTHNNRRWMPDADRSNWVAPAAIASVIVFLCSEAARAINGAAVPVDQA